MNATLLTRGYASLHLKANRTRGPELSAAEREAKDLGTGIWASCG